MSGRKRVSSDTASGPPPNRRYEGQRSTAAPRNHMDDVTGSMQEVSIGAISGGPLGQTPPGLYTNPSYWSTTRYPSPSATAAVAGPIGQQTGHTSSGPSLSGGHSAPSSALVPGQNQSSAVSQEGTDVPRGSHETNWNQEELSNARGYWMLFTDGRYKSSVLEDFMKLWMPVGTHRQYTHQNLSFIQRNSKKKGTWDTIPFPHNRVVQWQLWRKQTKKPYGKEVTASNENDTNDELAYPQHEKSEVYQRDMTSGIFREETYDDPDISTKMKLLAAHKTYVLFLREGRHAWSKLGGHMFLCDQIKPKEPLTPELLDKNVNNAMNHMLYPRAQVPIEKIIAWERLQEAANETYGETERFPKFEKTELFRELEKARNAVEAGSSQTQHAPDEMRSLVPRDQLPFSGTQRPNTVEGKNLSALDKNFNS